MHHQLHNNSDAAFGKSSRAKKPSALLLHYNYGAAAVKLWGRKTHILENCAKKFRPKKPTPAPSGPSKKVHDRSRMLKKYKTALAAALKAKKTATSKGQRKAAWDEDDVMLFLRGNSRAASERREEKRKNFEKWRQDVA